jgi:L-alanine-DL-glutamate epimerase-like enolase superfamily enzyme
MKIAQIETRALEMPYTKPLVTATNNFTVARGLLVKAVTDAGVEGYGYSDLFPRSGETPETARHARPTAAAANEREDCRLSLCILLWLNCLSGNLGFIECNHEKKTGTAGAAAICLCSAPETSDAAHG